jgi:hypothetical protein
MLTSIAKPRDEENPTTGKAASFTANSRDMVTGAADFQRRRELFGECKRIEGETSGQFYAWLHHWLDRVIPKTKLPLHAPRQTGD